jgi:hypothetical protein
MAKSKIAVMAQVVGKKKIFCLGPGPRMSGIPG